MEIGPIFRALRYNKTRFVLISLEVALTLAVVVNCVSMMVETYREMSRPTGLPEDVLFEVDVRSFDPAFEEKEYAAGEWDADLELLRSLAGVERAAKAGYILLDGNLSTRDLIPRGSEMEEAVTLFYTVGEGALEAYGAEIVAGRDFVAEDFLADQGQNQYDANLILSQAMADYLFPDGNALGQVLGGNDEGEPSYTVVGIVGELTNPYPGVDEFSRRAALIPARLCRGHYCRFLVRTTPEAAAGLAPLVEEELLARRGGRRIVIHSLTELRAWLYTDSRFLIQALVGVMGLLLFVTTLGMVGVTSFSVTQRTRQIGTRRALGARRGDVLRYFLTENLLVTSAGLALGSVLAYLLSYFLMQHAQTARLEWPLLVTGMGLLYLVGLGATLVPALRGARVPPVVATRCV